MRGLNTHEVVYNFKRIRISKRYSFELFLLFSAKSWNNLLWSSSGVSPLIVCLGVFLETRLRSSRFSLLIIKWLHWVYLLLNNCCLCLCIWLRTSSLVFLCTREKINIRRCKYIPKASISMFTVLESEKQETKIMIITHGLQLDETKKKMIHICPNYASHQSYEHIIRRDPWRQN